MSYLKKLENRFAVSAKEIDEDFNVLEIIKMDTRFRQASTTLVQAVRHFDHKHPEIGAAEILAAIMNDAMGDLFPNLHLDD